MAGVRRNVELYRRRVRVGLTQAQVAELLTGVVQAAGPTWQHTILTREYVSRLEAGKITWPNTVYRAALRTVLGVDTDADLGLYCQRVGARAEVEAVRRRDFLATLPAVAMTGSSLSELVAAATAHPVPPPRRVGLEHAAQVRDLVRQANMLDHVYGGGLAREVIAAQVRWAVGLLEAHVDRAAESELPSAVGHLCCTAGWAAHDSGLDDSARHYYSAALRCAEQAEDWHLRGRALCSLAQIVAYSGRGDDALTLAQQAAVRADRLDPCRRVRVFLQEARAHAQIGKAQDSVTAIGRAEDEYATADPANEPGMVNAVLCPAELMGDSGSTLYTLALRGQYIDGAVSRLRESVDTYPADYPRSRALATARLATLLMRSGDPAEAVQFGHQALDTADTINSIRVADSVRNLHRATAEHRGIPEVDALRQRAAHTLAGVSTARWRGCGSA
jgi:transcriptional regulator with XRE-family HTH domain/tetratricopeptide (TPR) repeat protein